MSEPTSALSFEDLLLYIAREAGIAYYGADGDEPAVIPVNDYHDLELCKKIVNDAIRMFISDAPPKGWRWMRRIMSVTLTATRITGTADSASATTIVDSNLTDDYDSDDDLNDYWCYILTGTGAGSYAQITDYNGTTGQCTVADWLDEQGNPGGTDPDTDSTFAITPVETVGGNISRYPLAENFGGEVDGPIKYSSNTNHSTIIDWCDESTIREKRAVSVQTSYPSLAAIRPIEPKSGGFGPKRRWELIVDPQPVAADTLEFPYTLFFDELQLIGGISSGGSATTLIDSSFAKYYPDDYFNGWKCYIISGTGRNSQGVITDFTGSTFTITVANWLGIDNSSDSGEDPTDSTDSAYYIVPRANLHPAGFRFDEVIKSACLAQAEMQIEDISAGYAAKYQQKDLPNAHRIDLRSAPRKLYPQDRIIQERTWTDITTDHDV